MTDDIPPKVRALFRQLDTDNSGYIESAELDELLELLGVTDVDERAQTVPVLLQKMDADGDGQITIEEFAETAIDMGLVESNETEMEGMTLAQRAIFVKAWEIFDDIDEDGSGTIDIGELEQVLEGLGVSDPYERRTKAREMMQDLDEDGSGEIDRDEFEIALKEGKFAFLEQQEETSGTSMRHDIPKSTQPVGFLQKPESIFETKLEFEEEEEAVPKTISVFDLDDHVMEDTPVVQAGSSHNLSLELQDSRTGRSPRVARKEFGASAKSMRPKRTSRLRHSQGSASGDPREKTEEEKKRFLRDIFELADEDGSGEIGPKELYEILQDPKLSKGRKISRQHVERVMKAIDTSGDGQLDFDEFCVAFERLFTDDAGADIHSAEVEALTKEVEDLNRTISLLKDDKRNLKHVMERQKHDMEMEMQQMQEVSKQEAEAASIKISQLNNKTKLIIHELREKKDLVEDLEEELEQYRHKKRGVDFGGKITVAGDGDFHDHTTELKVVLKEKRELIVALQKAERALHDATYEHERDTKDMRETLEANRMQLADYPAVLKERNFLREQNEDLKRQVENGGPTVLLGGIPQIRQFADDSGTTTEATREVTIEVDRSSRDSVEYIPKDLVEEELLKYHKRITELTEALEVSRSTMTNNSENFANCEKRAHDLELERNKLRAEMEDLKNRVMSYASERDALTAQLAMSKRELENQPNLRRQMASFDERMKERELEIRDEMEGDFRKAQAHIEALKTQLSNNEKTIAAQDEQQRRLKDQLEDSQQRLNEFKEKYESDVTTRENSSSKEVTEIEQRWKSKLNEQNDQHAAEMEANNSVWERKMQLAIEEWERKVAAAEESVEDRLTSLKRDLKQSKLDASEAHLTIKKLEENETLHKSRIASLTETLTRQSEMYATGADAETIREWEEREQALKEEVSRLNEINKFLQSGIDDLETQHARLKDDHTLLLQQQFEDQLNELEEVMEERERILVATISKIVGEQSEEIEAAVREAREESRREMKNKIREIEESWKTRERNLLLEVEELEKEIKHLQDQLADGNSPAAVVLKEEVEHYKERVSDLTVSLQEARQQPQSMEVPEVEALRAQHEAQLKQIEANLENYHEQAITRVNQEHRREMITLQRRALRDLHEAIEDATTAWASRERAMRFEIEEAGKKEGENEKLNNKLKEAQRRAQQLEENLSTSTETVRSLEVELTSKQNRAAADAAEKISDLHRQIEEQDDLIADYEDRMGQKESEYSRTLSELNSLKTEHKSFVENSKLQKETDQRARSQIEEMTARMKEQKMTFSVSQDKFVKENSDLRSQVSELEHKLRMEATKYRSLEQRLSLEVSSERDTAVTTARNAEQRARKEVETLQHQLNIIKEEYHTYKSSYSSETTVLQQTLHEHQSNYRQLQEELDLAIRAKVAAEARVATMEGELEANFGNRGKVGELHVALLKAQQERDAALQELSTIRTTRDVDFHGMLGDRQYEFSSLKENVSQLSAENEALRAERNAAKRKLQFCQDELDRLTRSKDHELGVLRSQLSTDHSRTMTSTLHNTAAQVRRSPYTTSQEMSQESSFGMQPRTSERTMTSSNEVNGQTRHITRRVVETVREASPSTIASPYVASSARPYQSKSTTRGVLFSVDVCNDGDALTYGINGPAFFNVLTDSIQILSKTTGAVVASWPLNHIKRYGRDTGVFSFEIGSIDSMAGVFFLASNDMNSIFAAVDKVANAP